MGTKIKLLLICASLLFGAKAHGDTRVLVYNNTLQSIDFELRQTNTTLSSSYWTAGADSISATKAEEVLSIKKSGGVTNGRTYGFELDVSDGSSTTVFKIQVEGKTVGRKTTQAVGDGEFFDDFFLRSAGWENRTVRYKKEGNGDFIFVISDRSERLFRFPVQDRTLIDEGSSATNPFVGPLSPDMRTGDRSRGMGISCMAFNGFKNPPHCYSGHKGTDFMLKGGFRQMDRPGNLIVAARAGTVVAIEQSLYDRCRAKAYSNDQEGWATPDCDGQNGPNLDGNHIVIDHGDGLFTEYYHLKTDSALVELDDEVICGQPLASIGSSGFSSKPHLHFEVRMCLEGRNCDEFGDGGHVAVNPYNGTYTGRGYWVDQGSGRIPADTCAVGQPVYSGPVMPPARGCSADTDCGQGFYCNKRLGENRCLAEGSFALGDACYKNRECSSGKCQGTGDARACVCDADSDCGAGRFCNNRAQANRCLVDGSLEVGQSCDKNQQCTSGKCQGTGSARMCVCDVDSDCASGEFCNNRAGANRCLVDSSLTLGQSCDKNQECSSGKCQGSGNSRMCVCNVNSDCANGQYCNNRAGQNRCLADASTPIGQSCDTNNECASGKCQGSGNSRMCVCNVNSDCANGQYCNNRAGQNRCLADASTPIGQSCDTNNECASGKCQGSGNSRMCVCNVNSDCANGQYCNNRAGQNRCLADSSKSMGQSCVTNNECETDKCEQNICVCKKNSDCPSSQKCKTPINKKNYCKA